VAAFLAAGATLAACGSSDSPSAGSPGGSDGYTLSIGMTATNGVVDGNMAWGQYAGTLLKALKPVGVDKITFATFEAGPEVQAALLSGAVDIAINGDLPALQARGSTSGAQTRQIGFTMINEAAGSSAGRAGPPPLQG
jgi:ABC-type nitrate/sulfonate/bicarbonate transport system substrate-binding protein